MSECRVGIIAEGITDIYLIEGILTCAFPARRFVFQQISPTAGELSTGRKAEGFGWRSVYQACCELAPRLEILNACGKSLDLLVIHLDCDVAGATYQQANIETERQNLPCAEPGDSVALAGETLQQVVCDWIGTAEDEASAIAFCLPFINTEAWAGYLIYPEYRQKFTEQSTEREIYQWLLAIGNRKANKSKQLLRQKDGRVRKVTRNYRRMMDDVTMNDWITLKTDYLQAKRFALQLSRWASSE